MDIRYFAPISVYFFILCSCKNVTLRKDFFYNSKLDTCIEIELDDNYILIDHDSSDMQTSFGVELVYKHQKIRNVTHRIAYPTIFFDAINLDSTATFSDEWLKIQCKNLEENIMINEIFLCNLAKINRVDYLTFGYSELQKHQGFNIYFESYKVDFNTPKVFIIKTICYNEKIGIALVEEMHYAILKNLSIKPKCKSKLNESF